MQGSPLDGRASNKNLLVSSGEFLRTKLHPLPIDPLPAQRTSSNPLVRVLFKALTMDLMAILFLNATSSTTLPNVTPCCTSSPDSFILYFCC
jgi:hypothetical protein